MDRLRTMESFTRVMRSGSFTVAARQLGVSRALVSRHIIDLERHLGTRLLNRSTRSVTPTEQARSYLQFCERIFRELEGEQAFVRSERSGVATLRIVAPKSFGTLHLADAVLAFAATEPQLRVSLVLEDFSFRPYDFVEKDYDLAVCVSPIRDSALMSRRIGTLDWVVCASPDYIRRHGAPKAPADLKRHACLAHINLALNDRIWQFERTSGRSSVKIDGPFLSNSGLVLRKAALRSLGVAILPRYCIAADLAAGTLVPLLPRHKPTPRPVSVVYLRSATHLETIRRFVSFLTRWFRSHDPNRGTLGS